MKSRLARLFKAVGIAIGVLLLQFVIGLLCAPFVDDVVVTTLLANVVISLFVLWTRWSTPQRFTYGDAPGRLTRRALGWIAVGLSATAFAAQGAARWAAENLDTSQIDEIQSTLESSNETLLLIAIIVAAPVGEELLMRGFLYPILRRRVSMWPAVAISALAFAVMHGNYQQGLLAIVLGVFLAVVVERTRRVWPAIIVHMVANASAVVLPTEWREVLTSTPAMALFGVVTVVAVIRIATDRGPATRGEDGSLAAPDGDGALATHGRDWALGARGEAERIDVDFGGNAPGDVGMLKAAGVGAGLGAAGHGMTDQVEADRIESEHGEADPGEGRPGEAGQELAGPSDANGAAPPRNDRPERR
ncbi:MAG: type II CAAX endopeptidase family protein [Actinomycetaceae bacterium]|nr:type II CAAX endopeptidase family protein [Actinomycetaceae bacterium]